jgi:hypothetical protein
MNNQNISIPTTGKRRLSYNSMFRVTLALLFVCMVYFYFKSGVEPDNTNLYIPSDPWIWFGRSCATLTAILVALSTWHEIKSSKDYTCIGATLLLMCLQFMVCHTFVVHVLGEELTRLTAHKSNMTFAVEKTVANVRIATGIETGGQMHSISSGGHSQTSHCLKHPEFYKSLVRHEYCISSVLYKTLPAEFIANFNIKQSFFGYIIYDYNGLENNKH